MNDTRALCPSCKREVVFDVSDGASYCPACGARFELTQETTRHKRPRFIHGIIFALWMFAPGVVALLAFLLLRTPNHRIAFDNLLSAHAAMVWTWFALAYISSCGCCLWLTGRFTDRIWVRVVMGVFLGTGIMFCNLFIAFFGACAFLPGSL